MRGLGFRVLGFSGLGFQGFTFQGFRVWGLGFRVSWLYGKISNRMRLEVEISDDRRDGSSKELPNSGFC